MQNVLSCFARRPKQSPRSNSRCSRIISLRRTSESGTSPLTFAQPDKHDRAPQIRGWKWRSKILIPLAELLKNWCSFPSSSLLSLLSLSILSRVIRTTWVQSLPPKFTSSTWESRSSGQRGRDGIHSIQTRLFSKPRHWQVQGLIRVRASLVLFFVERSTLGPKEFHNQQNRRI